MSNLNQFLVAAKAGDEGAFEMIVKTFRPLLINASFRAGSFDEDCYQECLIALHKAITRFEIR